MPTSKNLTSAGRKTSVSRHNGDQLRAPLRPIKTIVLWWSEGLQGGPQLGPHYVERRQFLGQLSAIRLIADISTVWVRYVLDAYNTFSICFLPINYWVTIMHVTFQQLVIYSTMYNQYSTIFCKE